MILKTHFYDIILAHNSQQIIRETAVRAIAAIKRQTVLFLEEARWRVDVFLSPFGRNIHFRNDVIN